MWFRDEYECDDDPLSCFKGICNVLWFYLVVGLGIAIIVKLI